MFGLSFVGLGLKFLGLGRWIRDFIKENWKWILPLIAAVCLFFYHQHAVNQAYDTGKLDGEKHMAELVKKKVQEQNKKNRKIEEKNKEAIFDYVDHIIKEKIVRQEKETVHLNTLEKLVYPDCKIPPEALQQRNDIRAFGPQDE